MKLRSLLALFAATFCGTHLSAIPYSVLNSDLNVFVEQSFSHTFETSLDGSSGELVVDTSYTHIWHERAWQNGFIEAGLAYEVADHDFNLAGGIGTGKTWTIDFGLIQRIQNNLSFLAKVEMDFSREADADFSDGAYFTGYFAANYDWTDRMNFSFGLYYQSELEDEDIFLPMASIDWRVTDKFRIRTSNGIFMQYDFNGDGSSVLEWNAKYDVRQYRLVNGNALRRRDLSLGVAYKHYIMDFFYVQGFVDYIFHRKFKVRHDHADLATLEAKGAARIGITGGMDF